MSNDVLFKTMRSVESVCTLTVTGGEPSLAPEVLENLLQVLYWQKVSIGAFYIVSNGRNHNRYRRFLTAVERLYSWSDEKDACTLTVSRDQFHPNFDTYQQAHKFELREEETGQPYGEFPPYFRLNERHNQIFRVLSEGRALETGWGNEAPEQQTPWELNHTGDYVIDPLVYVSANGNVVSCCNMSFDRIDRESKGNVLETSLPAILESYCTCQVEEQESMA
jgi:hypothetical protein